MVFYLVYIVVVIAQDESDKRNRKRLALKIDTELHSV